MNPQALIELLRDRVVYIQTHNFPDPDAIASAFALQEFLGYHQVPSFLCYDGRIDRLSSKRMLDSFGITMHSSSDIHDMQPDDYIVLVDSQKLNSNVTDFIGDEVACIDHHPIFIKYEYRYADIRPVGACSSLIASYFKETGTPISQEASAALCYGIKMDTADFTRGVDDLDVQMFAWLYAFANWELVKNMYSNTLEYNDLQAYGCAIQGIRIYGSTAFAYIPFNCAPALIAIISDFLLSLDIVDVSVVYAKNTDGIRFSIRNERKDLKAGDLIALALKDIGTGGGHPAMAGGMIPTDKISLLGDNLKETIHTRFLTAEESIRAGGL